MSLPMSLAYGLSKISGYSTNYYRLDVANQTTATNNSVVILNLPINCLLNMKSLSWHFTAQCTDITNADGAGSVVKPLLPDIGELIQRVELYAGGVQISSGCQNQSTIYTMKKIFIIL